MCQSAGADEYRGLNDYQYYGSIFLFIITVYGTSKGPQNDIGNFSGPCSSFAREYRQLYFSIGFLTTNFPSSGKRHMK